MSESDADLSPRTNRPAGRPLRWIPVIVSVAVLGVVVYLVWGLVGGALFFYNADEGVARRDELGDDRFRMLGLPVAGTEVETFRDDDPVVAFAMSYCGVAVDVVHFGDPPDLFQPGVPVVLEGSWEFGDADVPDFAGLAGDGWHFNSDRMVVKHDNDYRDDVEYDERVAEAEQCGPDAAASSTGSTADAAASGG